MIILHVYNPNVRPDEQLETIDFLSTLEGYEIHHFANLHDLDYSIALSYLWNLGKPFIILEQDKVPTKEIIDGMASCPEKICVANYMLSAKKMMLPKPVSAHRDIVRGNPSHIDELRHITTEEYADLYGFGLTKITPFDRYPWAPHTWKAIDVKVSRYTAAHSMRAHIHPMVKHNHA